MKCKFLMVVVTACLCCSCMEHEQTTIITNKNQVNTVLTVSSKDTTDAVKFKLTEDHWHHKTTNLLSTTRLKKEIFDITKTLGNVKYSKGLSDLVKETLIIESGLGSVDHVKVERYTKTYGLVQFTIGSAKSTLKWLRNSDSNSYKSLMTYYDKKLSLRDNLRYNVRFNIAICIEYYYSRDKDFQSKISTIAQRARLWKKHYNTYKGSGTVSQYIAKVNKFNKITNRNG